jgi:two-component system sensor histidine kinase CssS
LVAFRSIDEKAKIQDLKVAHDDILLNTSNLDQPQNRFGKMRNLSGISNLVVRVDSSNRINISKMGKPPDEPVQGFPPSSGVNQSSLGNWMATFIKSNNVNEAQFKESYYGRKFFFIISSINSSDKSQKLYLISYVPNMEDNKLLYMVMGVGLMFIIFGFIAAKIVAGYIAKPLKQLEDYTIRIAHKDWKDPIKVKNEDEIGRLANSMNTMRTELKRADEEEKMFLQSISHDLKTPVMVIMSHAEAIIDGMYIDSVEKTADIIKNEAISLEKKIKQLLYLNTLDYVLENNSKATKFSLRQLLLYIINRFEMVNSSIQWELDIEEAYIYGNSDKIQVSIENVLENSLRYAKEKISVKLRKKDSSIVLEIYNDGPKIDEKHINHIFDNLYKDKTGNFGLGLAISRKIIDFYSGEIKAINRDKGVSFIIKTPTV